MNIEIRTAIGDDAKDAVTILDKAYYSDFVKYGYCPGYHQSVDIIKEAIETSNAFMILSDESPIGYIRVKNRGNGDYFLCSICIIPRCENQGVGQMAMRYLEQHFTDAKHWSLETPADKERNCCFYRKCGFQTTQEYMDGSVKIVLFEKNTPL